MLSLYPYENSHQIHSNYILMKELLVFLAFLKKIPALFTRLLRVSNKLGEFSNNFLSFFNSFLPFLKNVRPFLGVLSSIENELLTKCCAIANTATGNAHRLRLNGHKSIRRQPKWAEMFCCEMPFGHFLCLEILAD